MKKMIIAIATIAIVGIPNSAMAFAVVWPLEWSKWLTNPKPNPNPKKPSVPEHYLEIIKLIKQHLEVKQKQLEQAQKTHNAIMSDQKSKTTPTDYTSFFFKKPELIYKDGHPDIPTLLTKILQEEEITSSHHKSRDFISERIQYAAAIDKAVSLQAFQETENRFEQISKLVEQIDKTVDLKSIAELQARIKGMLTMIQNETAKFQMVGHSRNAEQTLISQQKQKRNMKILNSKNSEMPTIRSIR
ncbi:type IV secretion system protein [Bartonella refiksaydamii]|uniref:type IV secretion system protein n=1 Tax=Bartonella refiksaydamii TaxID=2654951 RepID=UPI0012EB6645|nr:type IV secretion system protein [Bartonella refiksaydamii]